MALSRAAGGTGAAVHVLGIIFAAVKGIGMAA
jgi:hypothetical protein